jgi:hypothetical protein
MALRTKLDDLGKMEGIGHTEEGCSLTDINFMIVCVCEMLCLVDCADPEEFLNMLFKHTLRVDPFLMIRFVMKYSGL